MSDYSKIKIIRDVPRLPLEGYLDLTYRCNNNCRHCWVRIAPGSAERQNELGIDEIKRIADEARNMGCRKWFISGGEPMLRNDFVEIFDYLTRNVRSYYLNTNGSLITPPIARLMKRKGVKLIALYGATARVHDHITRNAGSFDAALQGIAYLKEARANFTVQVIPMKDNHHQIDDMIKLAQSLSSTWRLSSPFLFLSATGDRRKNMEIRAQRLPPATAAEVEFKDSAHDEVNREEILCRAALVGRSGRIFEQCVATKAEFHIDPYGTMSFCQLITDPAFRYNLKRGNLRDGWEKFFPSLAEKIIGKKEHLKNCGSCRMRSDCWWCPGYAYLEHRRPSAKIEYLCSVAKRHQVLEKDWQTSHRRYYQIAGLTIEVTADLPITDTTFQERFKPFVVTKPGDDVIAVRHHFFLPDVDAQDLGGVVYRKAPWVIYKKGNVWIYLEIASNRSEKNPNRVVVCNHDYSRIRIYNSNDHAFRRGNLNALTLFATDQIVLTHPLAERGGCYLHASGVKFFDAGLLFVGHSDAGKSTMVKMLNGKAEILCDDRMIVRRHNDGFRIYGTWSHGEVPIVSAGNARLKAIFFLKKSHRNRIEPIARRSYSIMKLLACLVKSFPSGGWWEKMFELIEKLGREVPCYNLYFDRSGEVVKLLEQFCRQPAESSGRIG